MIGLSSDSKRRAVDLGLAQADEDFSPTLQRVLGGETIKRKFKVAQVKGIEVAVYKLIWDAAYNAGYNLRRFGLSNSIEQNIWGRFGRNENTQRGDV